MIPDVAVIGEDVAGGELQRVGLQASARAAVVQHSTAESLRAVLAGTVPYAGTPPWIYRESWEIDEAEDGEGVALHSDVPYAERLERRQPTVDPTLEAFEAVYEEAMAAGVLPLT